MIFNICLVLDSNTIAGSLARRLSTASGGMAEGFSAAEMTNIAFLIWASFAIFWMIQGAGLFYCGLSKRKSALTQAAMSLVATAVVQIQWYIWVSVVIRLSDDAR